MMTSKAEIRSVATNNSLSASCASGSSYKSLTLPRARSFRSGMSVFVIYTRQRSAAATGNTLYHLP